MRKHDKTPPDLASHDPRCRCYTLSHIDTPDVKTLVTDDCPLHSPPPRRNYTPAPPHSQQPFPETAQERSNVIRAITQLYRSQQAHSPYNQKKPMRTSYITLKYTQDLARYAQKRSTLKSMLPKGQYSQLSDSVDDLFRKMYNQLRQERAVNLLAAEANIAPQTIHMYLHLRHNCPLWWFVRIMNTNVMRQLPDWLKIRQMMYAVLYLHAPKQDAT